MLEKKVLKFLEAIIIFLLLLVLGFLLFKNLKLNYVKKANNIKEITVVSKKINPINKAKATKISYENLKKIRISSSSRELIKSIANQIPDYSWMTYEESTSFNIGLAAKRRNNILKNGGIYYIDVPEGYFKDYGLKITEFNFSNINLGSLSTIPDFSQWRNLNRLNFQNCQITNVEGFNKINYIKRINYINLQKNRIADPSVGIVKNQVLDLKNQEIHIQLGYVQKNSTLIGILPNIFVKSYADYQAPKNLVSSLKINGSKVTMNTSVADTNRIIPVKIEDSNSRFNGSKVYFEYAVYEKGTKIVNNNSNSNNNNNNYNGEYNYRRRRDI